MFFNSSVISGENTYGLGTFCIASLEASPLRTFGAAVEVEHPREASLFKLYGQANKRTWWMPRQLEATKDVVVCDKLGGADKQALYPEISEWGNPAF